jgi:hypothetical protein
MSGMDLSALRYHELIDLAGRALAAANEQDLTELTDAEITEATIATSRVRNLAEAAHVAAVGRLDTSKAWQEPGARTAGAWVAWECLVAKSRADAAVRCARRLRDMPGTEAAFLAGRLTTDHVRLLAHCHATNADAFAEEEQHLIGLTESLLFHHVERVVQRWVRLRDEDDAERHAETRRQQRRVDCSQTIDDMWVLDALLDPVTGAIVARELHRLEQRLFEQDWAEARERLGDAATPADLRRTAKQRRADALRLMAERSAAKPAEAKEPRVLLHVLAGTDAVQRMCELSDGTILTPGEVLPVLRWADVSRVIFDGPSRVLDVGVRQRLFTGATRTAVELRDLECAHPSCTVRFERCEIDHIVPWEEGGQTTQDNGKPRCPFHHRWRHRRTSPAA